MQIPCRNRLNVAFLAALLLAASVVTFRGGPQSVKAASGHSFLINISYANGQFQYDGYDGTSTIRTTTISVTTNDSVYFTSNQGRFAVFFPSNSPMANLTYEGLSTQFVGGKIRSDAQKSAYKYDVTLEVSPGQFIRDDPEMDVSDYNGSVS